MAEMTVSAQNTNEFVFALSDGELERQLQEAVQASIDDYAFHTQLQETLRFSTCDLQLTDIPSSSKESDCSPISIDESSSSYSKVEKEDVTVNCDEHDNGFEFQGYGAEKGGNSKEKEADTGLEWRQCQVQKTVPLELCRICCEDSAEIFEGIRCLHRFCHSCMTKYIHSWLEQKRHLINCPHESCSEALTPQECRYFLPCEMIDAWFAAILEAEIPDSQKVYCPFPDCSGMLVKEDVVGLSVEEIVNAECPFCNRMFCVKCMVPWHGYLDCEQFQTLPPAERSEADLRLLNLAETWKWKRCDNCKRMIEKVSGCNTMTCRCGYAFCYGCGSRNCNCHRRL